MVVVLLFVRIRVYQGAVARATYIGGGGVVAYHQLLVPRGPRLAKLVYDRSNVDARVGS